MKKYITILLDQKSEFTIYNLVGSVPDELYILSLLVKDFYPAYFLSNSFMIDRISMENQFVIVENKGSKIIIKPKKKYKKIDYNELIMSLEKFYIMVEDWVHRFDGAANKIYFIRRNEGAIDVQSDWNDWSPDF